MKHMNLLRIAFWIVGMAYVGSFLFGGPGVRSFSDISAVGALIGGVFGLFFAILLTQRARRKHI